MSEPGIVIRLPLEGRPQVRFDVLSESEERRLADWLRSRQELAELVDHAVELATEARAA